MAVKNPLERKLAKRTFVWWLATRISDDLSLNLLDITILEAKSRSPPKLLLCSPNEYLELEMT